MSTDPANAPKPLPAIVTSIGFPEETNMVKEVRKTHSGDDFDFPDIVGLLDVVENILNFSNLNNPLGINTTKLDQDSWIPDQMTLYYIDAINSEIQQIRQNKSNSLGLFDLLRNLRWDAKLVLVLSSFAVTYGEFWLLAQTFRSNPLAKSMAILKKVPSFLERSSGSGPNQGYDARVVKAMLDITRLIVEFYVLSTRHETSNGAISNIIPTAVYESVKVVITCVRHISNLSAGHNSHYLTIMGWNSEIQTTALYLDTIRGHLQREMDVLRQVINKRKEKITFETIKQIVCHEVHVDNMRVLSALITAEDPEPLINCATMKPASLEYLKNKNVLLLISNLDTLVDELLLVLNQFYSCKERTYEVVWIPMVDPSIQSNEVAMEKFNKLQSTMKWYSLRQSIIMDHDPVERFFRKIWGFEAKPIIAVLNHRGKVLSTNAITIMLIWGNMAFPFSSNKERELWLEETWKLEFLVGRIEPTVLEWIRSDKYIFLYGGDDIKLISEFAKEARKVSAAAGINLEMIYIGNSRGIEKTKKVMSIINRDKLSHCWTEQMVWFFWTRLEGMLLSHLQIDTDRHGTLHNSDAKHSAGTHGELAHADKDPIVQEIMKLMSFGWEEGWAVFAQGSQVLPSTHLNTVVHVLLRYKEWEMDVESKGFLTAFWERLKAHHDELRLCIGVEYGSIHGLRLHDQEIKCPECHRFMEKYNALVCYHDEPSPALN